MIIAAIVLVAAMMILVERTKTGQAIRAVAENRDAAMLMGVNVNMISAHRFRMSTALGVRQGSWWGPCSRSRRELARGLAVKGFAVLILGGLGSFPGAIVGGLVLGVSESMAAGFISSAYKDVIAFVVMIVVLLFGPQGLLGHAHEPRTRVVPWLAGLSACGADAAAWVTVKYFLHLSILALIWVVLAQGQNLIQGFTGYVSIVAGRFHGHRRLQLHADWA